MAYLSIEGLLPQSKIIINSFHPLLSTPPFGESNVYDLRVSLGGLALNPMDVLFKLELNLPHIYTFHRPDNTIGPYIEYISSDVKGYISRDLSFKLMNLSNISVDVTLAVTAYSLVAGNAPNQLCPIVWKSYPVKIQ